MSATGGNPTAVVSAGMKRKQPGDITPVNTQPPPSTSTSTGVPLDSMNWEATRSKIMNSMSASDLRGALSIITELRNSIELVHSTEYPKMLASLLPVFTSIIKAVPCTPAKSAFASPRESTDGAKQKGPGAPSGSSDGVKQKEEPGADRESSDGAKQKEQKEPGADRTDKTSAAPPLQTNVSQNEKMEEEVEYRLRHAILELCTRLPQNEYLRPYVGKLFAMVMDVLHSDYEDNALLAARVVFELHKSYRPMLVDNVQPFLDFVQISYRTLPSSLKKNFAQPETSPGAPMNLNTFAPKSTASFRVLTECPLTVMLLFQMYPKYISKNLMQLLPLMMDCLGQKPPPHAAAILAASPDKPIKVSDEKSANEETSKKTALKAYYYKRSRELLSAQVKTLSFVTHLLRGYGEQMKPYEDSLATNVLSLFQMCPREALATRKDLLLALRHIFATDFRKGFFKHIDTLLDERILIGKHRQSEHTHLKGAAYGALADLLLHVRARLSMAQISRVVHIYSRVLHDASMNLPLVVQTTSARLLLNMVDPVYHNKEEKASLGRDILFRILETLMWKVGMLVDHGIADVKEAEKGSEERKFEDLGRQKDQKVDQKDIYASAFLNNPGTIQNIRELVKPLLSGIKTLIWCINNYGSQREKMLNSTKDKNEKTKAGSSGDKTSNRSTWYEELAVQGINVSERALIENYFVWTLEILKVFKVENALEGDKNDLTVSSKQDLYRGVLETFSSSIAVLDSFNFQQIVGPKVQFLINCIVDDDDVIVVPQTFLLQTSNVTSDFTSCLLRVLMQNSIDLDLGIDESDDEKIRRTSEVKMKLFGLIFNSLSTCPKNEKVLRPHLQCLIAACLRRAVGSDVKYWPGNHLTVLRKLFRAIAGGKFEESYKVILPLLPTLLNGLYRLYSHTEHEVLRKVIIELCLTIPARLSSLLPHLSLLLRIIIPALQTGDGDLVNLGLRTLEFWVDNLNSDFLFPIISRDERLLTELMATLSTHLQPAPYQYGLLTLRLLGKLGGKNRLFLKGPMAVSTAIKEEVNWPNLRCKWGCIRVEKGSTNLGAEDGLFSLKIPLERAMVVLEAVAGMAKHESECTKQILRDIISQPSKQIKIEDEDLLYLKEEMLYSIAQEQANAAFVIIRSAMAVVLNFKHDPAVNHVVKSEKEIDGKADEREEPTDEFSRNDLYVNFLDPSSNDDVALKNILKCLFFALNVNFLHQEASNLIEGLVEHMILILVTRGNVRRADCADGASISRTNEPNSRESVVQNGKLKPLLPFGRYHFGGALQTGTNYFILNEVLPEMLESREASCVESVLKKMKKLFNLLDRHSITNKVAPKTDGITNDEQETLKDAWVENLLFNLLQYCLEVRWEARWGLYEGICLIFNEMNQEWCRRFEIELMHVALFCLKDSPHEASLAQKEAYVFYVRILSFLYSDRSNSLNPSLIIHGPYNGKDDENEGAPSARQFPLFDAIPCMLLNEVACTKSIVRSAAFLGLEYIYKGGDTNMLTEIMKKHSSIIKRHIFSKSLRHLPLLDQVATIETFTLVMSNAPEIIPLSDNHVLVFLSELLKMMSVADGEMSSESISNSIIINKDGYSPKVSRSSCMVNKFSSLSHATGIFLRERFDVIFGQGGYRIKVDAELPIGIQYRVSALKLFHAVLKKHSSAFLEADSSSSIGNILPHIISLLFRSLTSRPRDAMEASYNALRDILSVTSTSREVKDTESRNTPRIPKNLLQMCIRPVLLNLRDYTKLSIPLLRGLSRLLSLLSSWFSKTLGEKLLEHLQRWADPDKIVDLHIWKRGEEPIVAAEIIGLFQLLPDDKSLFVEPLIKTTLKLESVLPKYDASFTESPFREPLAKYINKHGRSVAQFFINEHRFKNPIYSELLQDIIKRAECKELRATFTSKECSNLLIRVCFERPLAIIRSEKGKGSPSRAIPSTSSLRSDNLRMHGVNIGVEKLVLLQKDVKLKEEKLKIAKKDESRTKDLLQKKTSDASATSPIPPEKQKTINAAKQRFNKAHALVETQQKALKSAQSDYAEELKKTKEAQNDATAPKPMCLDALELQFQGFCLVETLASSDASYIKEHKDIVQAFRWLWRSKGRHFRLLHEDVMPPRYNGESRFLAKFLVSYSKVAPEDIDVLFDLIRIFLQPTSADFSFVRNYLKEAVCSEELPLAQKRLIMSRFASVVTSEGIEELKAQTIYLLAVPMLKYDFERSNRGSKVVIHEHSADSKDKVVHVGSHALDRDSAVSQTDKILDKELANHFLGEILTAGGKIRTYCGRLSVELLKICSLLLDFMGKELGQHQQTVLKFAWSVLKSEDGKAKHWAYIAICKFIVMFETPPRIILQVYVALLRSYQPETRELVKTALDVLIPSLPEKFALDDYEKAMLSTINILYEEGNSTPQLSHIWQIVLRHEKVFYGYRNKIIPHLVSSLQKLGLPPNSSIENKQLSVALVSLIVHWDENQSRSFSGNEALIVTERTDEEKIRLDPSLFQGLPSPESSPSKKLKIDEGNQRFGVKRVNRKEAGEAFIFEQGEIDVIVNFLVRMVFSISTGDKSSQQVTENVTTIFGKLISRWTTFNIRIEYFDKVISLCLDEIKRDKNKVVDDSPTDLKITKADVKAEKKGTINAKQTSTQAQGKVKNDEHVSNIILFSSLDLLIRMRKESPQNNFLRSNIDRLFHLIQLCFRRAADKTANQVRKNLRLLLVDLFHCDVNERLQGLCRSSLEQLMIMSLEPGNLLLEDDKSDTKGKGKGCRYDVLLFVLQVIEEVIEVNPSFMQTIASALVNAIEKLAKLFSQTTSKSRNAAKSSSLSASATETLFEAACNYSKKTYSMKSSKSLGTTPSGSGEKLLEPRLDLECFISCLRLIGGSHVPFTFTEERRKYLTVLHDTLEFNTDIRVLMTVTEQLGRWLSHYHTPLTKKEIKFFLEKILVLDSRGLPEIDFQPLNFLIATVMLRVCKTLKPSDFEENANGESAKDLDPSKAPQNIFLRGTSSSLMTASTKMRNAFSIIFATGYYKDESFTGEGVDCLSRQAAIKNISPDKALTRLLDGDFEGLGNRMWTFVFVDILLGICDHGGGIQLSTDSTFKISSPILVPFEDKSGGGAIDPSYKHFLGTLNKDLDDASFGQARFITSLRILASCDRNLSQGLLHILLGKAWKSIQSKALKLETVSDFERLLNQPYHAQFLKPIKSVLACSEPRQTAANAIKSFLQAISTLVPLPMISTDLLISLAANYNCWHEARVMLESQQEELALRSNDTTKDYEIAVASAVRRCYLELGETDTWMALKLDACTFPGFQKAFSLDMYGYVCNALQSYEHLVDQVELTNENYNQQVPTDLELSFLEDRWIALQRETCQWDVLAELAEDSGFSKLMMECAWKNRNWEKLRSLCSSTAAVSLLELGDIDVKMNEIFLAISDNKLNEIENLHAQTAQLCLYKWQLLPPIFSGCNTHIALLHDFNRLVDIRESGQIMVETRSYSASGKSYPDLKNLLNCWRNRLPNKWEPLSVWDDIFQWRSHMFTAITNKFQWTEQGTLASLHDRPWTAIRLAQTARQQGIPQVSLLSLGKLTDCAMDVTDAFSKLNEQILSYRKGSELERKGGLNLINTTNLSYFDNKQKSELFRLKADFLESLGGRTKATQAYCHAVQLSPTYSRAWTSWGDLCWSLADLVERQGRGQISETPEDREKKASNVKKVCQYLAQSMGCYLEAIQWDTSEECRSHLPRCIIMLAKDGPTPALLCTTFEKYATALPIWVWLPWIPQLLSSLCRTEAPVVKILLNGIISTYPQAAYFSLRSFYLERRDNERSRSSAGGNNNVGTSVSYAEELMSSLRKSQPTLWMSLESILEELIIRFRPSYEEELLATITALLQRADTQLQHQKVAKDGKDSDDEAIRSSFTKTLARVSAKFFNTNTDQTSSSKDERAKRTAEFTRRYKDFFERDFSMVTTGNEKEKSQIKLSLDEIISKLKKWKCLLESRVSSTPRHLPLMQVSPSLSAFSNTTPDLWAGSCDSPGTSISIKSRGSSEKDSSQSPSSSATAALTAAVTAAKAVASANIHEGGGIGHGGGWVSVEIPGQYAPNVGSDGKPTPELHTKLVKFEAIVEVSRRNDQLVRRIGMMGSDGRIHQFLLQFAIPYWTRTDERTAQLHHLLSRCLRKEAVSSRRNLWLRPTAVIPIAQRLRMTAEEKSHVSLDDIYAKDCQMKGIEYMELYNAFQTELKNVADSRGSNLTAVGGVDQPSSSSPDKNVRSEAFAKVKTMVSSTILKEYVKNQFGNLEQYFQFQRTFASQTALNSLLQYIFSVNERIPSKFIFDKRSAHVLSPDFRFSYTNQGFIDEKKVVPFRLTSNIATFIGPSLMRGTFIPAMASAATAINDHEENLEQPLQLLFRDDIVSWYLSKSSQRDGSQRTMQELERQLSDRVKKNVHLVQSRLHECVINKDDTPVDAGVRKLISLATSPDNLAAMPSNYAGWL